jgi:hypothetical protein
MPKRHLLTDRYTRLQSCAGKFVDYEFTRLNYTHAVGTFWLKRQIRIEVLNLCPIVVPAGMDV